MSLTSQRQQVRSRIRLVELETWNSPTSGSNPALPYRRIVFQGYGSAGLDTKYLSHCSIKYPVSTLRINTSQRPTFALGKGVRTYSVYVVQAIRTMYDNPGLKAYLPGES